MPSCKDLTENDKKVLKFISEGDRNRSPQSKKIRSMMGIGANSIGKEDIVTHTGLDSNQVSYILRKLRQCGKISMVRQSIKGSGQTYLYEMYHAEE